MQLPADLTLAGNIFASGAANVAGALAGVVPAPGAGLRLRVWAVTVGIFGTAAAPLRNFYEVVGGAAVSNILFVSREGVSGGEFTIPGGLLLAANLPVQARLTSSSAAVIGFAIVYTTTEAA